MAPGLGPCPTGGHASDSTPDSHTGHAEVGEQPPGCPHRGLTFWARRRRDLVLAQRGVSLPRTLCSPTTPPPRSSQRAHLCHAHVPTATPAASAQRPGPGTGAAGLRVQRRSASALPQRDAGTRSARCSEPGCIVVRSANSNSCFRKSVRARPPNWGPRGHVCHPWPADARALPTLPSAELAPRGFAMRTGLQPSLGAQRPTPPPPRGLPGLALRICPE